MTLGLKQNERWVSACIEDIEGLHALCLKGGFEGPLCK